MNETIGELWRRVCREAHERRLAGASALANSESTPDDGRPSGLKEAMEFSGTFKEFEPTE